jgi:hypothetical protein
LQHNEFKYRIIFTPLKFYSLISSGFTETSKLGVRRASNPSLGITYKAAKNKANYLGKAKEFTMTQATEKGS